MSKPTPHLHAFLVLLALSLPSARADTPKTPHADGVQLQEPAGGIPIDVAAGTVEVQGAGAADPNAPNATVARTKAERTARVVAARRLAKALSSLPKERLGCERGAPTEASIEAAALTAEASWIDWGSDGSVTLTLRLSLASLLPSSDQRLSGAEPKPGVVSPTAPLYLANAGRCVARARAESSSSKESR